MSSIIRDEVQQVQLPENAEPPKVVEVTMKKNQLFTLMLYAHSPTMNTHYLKERATLLKQRLEGKSGIDTIEIEGGHRYDFQILVHQQKLERLGLSLHQIAKSIQASIANTPLGNHQIGTMNYDFRIQGEITSKAELLALPIPLGKGKTIPLSQIAEVKKVYQDQDQLVHIGKAGDGV